MRQKKFLIFGAILIILRPWLWKVLNSIIHFSYSSELVIFLFAIALSFLFIRLKGKLWQLLLCIVLIDPIGSYLSDLMMFEIHYANNDVLFPGHPGVPDEMYRDFNSNFEIMMRHVSLKNWVIGIFKRIGIYLITVALVLFINKRRTFSKSKSVT